MENQAEAENHKNEPGKDAKKRVTLVAVFTLLILVILFVVSGDFRWVWAWVYGVVTVGGMVIAVFIMPSEVIAERGKKKENVERWDTLIIGLANVPIFGQYFVSALDHRFGWSVELPVWVHILGVVFYIAGNGLVVWSMRENRYFSTAVRIQHERGHTVCNSGPYRFLRHPGYVGMISEYTAIPIILGSLWGLIPAAMIAGLIIIRTVLEDRTLMQKLPGYREYAEEVKFRLVPGVW